MSKDKHQVTNWSEYNCGLKKRGSINIWINKGVLKSWQCTTLTGKRGSSRTYNDLAILTCLSVRKVYHLALRQCEGFVESFFERLNINISVPDYTTLCRRASDLEVDLHRLSGKDVTDIAVDSTGLKVYGEGEWKVRKHGWSKHRTWMKLHLAVDVNTQQIEATILTDNTVDDAQVVKDIVKEISKNKEVKSFRGDGAYDKKKVREPLCKQGIPEIIPPQHNAVKSKGNKQWAQQRDEAINVINLSSRKEWKEGIGYHKRSLAETAMFRYKTIIGGSLQSREVKNQKTEVKIGSMILNEMIKLTKPVSVKVA